MIEKSCEKKCWPITIFVMCWSAIFIGAFFVDTVESADWVYYTTSSSGAHYFDSKSVTFTSKNQVKVWARRVWSQRDAKEAKLLTGYTVKESKVLYAIDCRNNQRKMLKLIVYGQDGTPVSDSTYQNAQWELIIPDSTEDVLRQRVCKN